MRQEALALVAELENQPADTYVPPQSFVFIFAGLGEKERALAHQERAYEDGASPFNYLTPYVRACTRSRRITRDGSSRCGSSCEVPPVT